MFPHFFHQPQSRYSTKQSDGEALVMLELRVMQCISLLPSFSGSFWAGIVTHDSVLSTGQIEVFDI